MKNIVFLAVIWALAGWYPFGGVEAQDGPSNNVVGSIPDSSADTSKDTAQDSGYESPAQKLAKMRPSDRPKDVITSFHRRAVDSSKAPWRAVGRINVGGRVHCTGALVAENIVLTAAHCLYGKRLQKMVSPNSVHFLTGYAKGDYLAHSKVKQYTVGPGFDGSKGSLAANMPYDWALLLLEKPLGRDNGFLDLHEKLKRHRRKPGKGKPRIALPSTEIITAGYPADRAHVLSLEENCAVKQVRARGRVLISNCTAIPGDSGGPILQKPNGKWRLIGLNVASIQNKTGHGSIILSALAFRDTLAAIQRQTAKPLESKKPNPPKNQMSEPALRE